MSSSSEYGKFNPPPPGGFVPNNSLEVGFAFINRMVAPTPSNPYLLGLPPASVENTDSTTDPSYTIDFSKTPFTYLNASFLTTEPGSTDLKIALKNVPIGTMFLINGPPSYTPGKVGFLQLLDVTPVSQLSILDQTVTRNQLVIRNSTGLVSAKMN